MRRTYSKENTKGVAETPFDNVSIDMNGKFNPQPQRESGRDRDGIIPAEILPRPGIEKKR